MVPKETSMANSRRGEVPLILGEGRYTLCLTLGALAELEDAFRVESLAGVAERFADGRPSSRDLLVLLAAALRGGGHPLSDAEVAALPLAGGLPALGSALAEVLEAAFGGEGAQENPPQNPPQNPWRGRAAGATPSPGTR